MRTENGFELDDSRVGGEYASHTKQGDTSCPSDLLSEVAFDALGAARFLQNGNLSFAKEAVRSALDELSAVAVKLGVR